MYLKRLELLGFKSFKDKTKLEFNTGITAVIGPNGSGKSNISDAIRWVLGEQSAKTLRGSKMEDIIFSGTINKKPLGLASVSIVIDNHDKILAMPFQEITITRKLYRSGESEFLINGTQCRLKDIHQLFMDTGIGREGYSIIGQGSIDEILSSKSEDRRYIFEEAAGIVKYKLRRDEIFNKLESEKQNLIRIKDIILELENKLPVITKQSEKAKKYLYYSEQLKLFKINIFLTEERLVSEEIKKTEDNYLNLEKQLEDENIKNTNVIKLLEDNKNTLKDIYNSIEILNNKVANTKIEIEQKESAITLQLEQIKNLLSDINRLEAEIEVKQNKILENKNEIVTLQLKYEQLNNDILDKNILLNDKENEIKSINDKIFELEEHIKVNNLNIVESITSINKLKYAIEQLHIAIKDLKDKEDIIKLNLKNGKINISKQKLLLQNLTIHLEDIKNKIVLTKKDILLLQNKKLITEESLNSFEKELTIKQQDINNSNLRLKLLIELDENYEGYHKGVKSVLLFKKNNPNNLKGIISIVGDIINVPKYLVTAIEISFGNSIQNIITETEKDAEEAIKFLKTTKSGRATFLPLSSIKKRNIDTHLEILKDKSVIGMAKNIIGYDKKFENIISSLIGNILIVDTIDNAIRISKKNNYIHKIVTLEGDLINPHGAITGGAFNKSSKIIGRSSEIEELKRVIEIDSKQESELMQKVSDIKLKLETIDINLENLNKLFQEHERTEFKIIQDIDIKNKLLEDLYEKEKIDELEVININDDIIKYSNNIKEFTEEKTSLETNNKKLTDTLKEYQNKLMDYQSKKNNKMEEITELKIYINTTEQNILFNKQNTSNINELNLNIEEDIENNTLEINSLIGNKEKKLRNIEILKQEINLLISLQNEITDEITSLTMQKDTLTSNLDKMHFNEKEDMQLVSELKSEHSRLKVKIENLEEKKEYLYREIWEEYEITYQKALQYRRLDLTLEDLRKSEKKLKEEIKNLGNINLESMQEYKDIKERYEFLVKQKTDIEEAQEKLKHIIIDYTKLMEERFFSKFNLISENFGKVFRQIFGGGIAYLKLSNKENVLHSGIEIIAQPPGKKLQSLSLMSGGEKTLTAIAILFSILQMKPSPFCILDEIEAALDDANINKFANYLGKFSPNTQFILITHKKGTMEIANNIYGVTMEEEGISKLLSIKLD